MTNNNEFYRVLWLDDEHDDPFLKALKIEAQTKGIILEGYNSMEEGFAVLERNLEKFDAILLDGIFFEKKYQNPDSLDESGIGMAIKRINQLEGSRKKFPWFVLSGKDSFVRQENPILKAYKTRCYDKANAEDVIQLFIDIKTEAAKQYETQIRHRYSRVLELCSEDYLGEKLYNDLFDLIKTAERPLQDTSFKDFTKFRMVIELLFGRLKQLNIIPSEIIEESGWINGSSMFLAGFVKCNYQWVEKDTIHPTVSLLLKHLLMIIQDGSHSLEEKLTLKTGSFTDSNNTPYLFSSCLYMLMDILIWFKGFMDRNPDPEKNKKLWGKNCIEGTVDLDAQNNFYCGNILLTEKIMREKGLQKGVRVRILKSGINNKDRTKLYFKFYAIDAERID